MVTVTRSTLPRISINLMYYVCISYGFLKRKGTISEEQGGLNSSLDPLKALLLI